MIRRLAFLVGVVPLSAYALVRWVLTGRSALDLMDRFENWADA